MPPSASEPESGSVMAQAPILSSVMRSRPQRCIWAGVPNLLMVPAARPVETPKGVTKPGLTRQGSIVEINWAEGSALPRGWREGCSQDNLRSSCRWKFSCAISLRPNTPYIFRMMSKGATPWCSRSSRWGRISSSTNRRTAEAMACCSSDHSYMVFRSLIDARQRIAIGVHDDRLAFLVLDHDGFVVGIGVPAQGDGYFKSRRPGHFVEVPAGQDAGGV